MPDLGHFKFLAVHPSSDNVACHISDCVDLADFAERWHKKDDKYLAEFGYDMPVLWDDNCAPIENFTTRAAKSATDHIKEVRTMTFAEWIELVNHKMESDD